MPACLAWAGLARPPLPAPGVAVPVSFFGVVGAPDVLAVVGAPDFRFLLFFYRIIY